VFFVFTILYFVGGAVALRLLRGAEGREMIPNYDFWVDLPNLVRVSVYIYFVVIETYHTYSVISSLFVLKCV
jgi:hypothetical protein